MAFIGNDFIKSSGQANGLVMHSYSTATDDLATVKALDYFSDASEAGGWGLKDGDFILVSATDGASFLKMVVAGGNTAADSWNDFA